jgi:hypothetical protein
MTAKRDSYGAARPGSARDDKAACVQEYPRNVRADTILD